MASAESVKTFCSRIGKDRLLVQSAGGNVSWKEADMILYDGLLFRLEVAENGSQRRRNICFEPVRIIIREVISVSEDFKTVSDLGSSLMS